MNSINTILIFLVMGLCGGALLGGCGEGNAKDGSVTSLIPKSDLGTPIGSIAQIYSAQMIPVEGFGLVGGLKGTGSAECPAQLRSYLSRHIMAQVPEENVNTDRILRSMNTSVVWLKGMMPAGASQGQAFDVAVGVLEGSQTTSLEGGWLYISELVVKGSFGITTDIAAKVQGPVFIDTIEASEANKRRGHILGGAKTTRDYKVGIGLAKENYRLTNTISNRLNERFGFDTAKPMSPKAIEVTVPPRYRGRTERFAALVASTYLTENPAIMVERVKTHVRELATAEDKYSSEIALEAIGTQSLGKLGSLLNSSDERIRLHAGRCMLSLGDVRGLDALRDIAFGGESANRIEALEAIGTTARRTDAVSVAVRLLEDKDLNVKLAAYEQLRRLDDISIARSRVGRSFVIEQVSQGGAKIVYAARSGLPRIVLFGSPLQCRDNVFIQSADGQVIVNAPAGQPFVSIIRKNPRRSSEVVKLRSSFNLDDIITVLCEEPAAANEAGPGGLGVSYADMIALVKQMCDKGAVRAPFVAGSLPKITQ